MHQNLFLSVVFGLLCACSLGLAANPQKQSLRQDKEQGIQLPLRRVFRQRVGWNVLATDVEIVNGQEFTYLIPVNVGGREYPVIFDTGSSDLWIVSTDCTTSDCKGVKKFPNSLSNTLSMSGECFKLSYLLGSVTGNVAFETIDIARFKITSQVFALANETVGLDLSGTGNSGILGLSFPSIASISLTSGHTILQNLFANLDETSRFFAFKLGRGSGLDDTDSSFTIGQLDTSIASDMSGFTFTPVVTAGLDTFDYWKLPLQSLTIDSTVLPLSPSLTPGARGPIAVLDTGTTLILGPSSDVQAFWSVVSQQGAARKNPQTGMWEVRCDRGVSVRFNLGDKTNERGYAVDPGDISWAEGGSKDGWCMGGIQANDGVASGDWLLGDVFLRNVYVTHHGANSTHPPMIGLLSLTDPVSSIARFRQSRGPDPLPLPTAWIRQSVSKKSPLHTTTIYVVSSISGFFGGAIVAVIIRIRRGSTNVLSRKYTRSL